MKILINSIEYLLDVFKHNEYPILIKGCFGFGLKEIVKNLNQYNQINLSWPELDDGLLSSFKAREIYLQNNSTNEDTVDTVDSIDTTDTIIDIVEYNYVDCLALIKIFDWMRSYTLKN
jgi:hypothetical protein